MPIQETRPLLREVDCIRLAVPDLEAGLAFYRDRLGHALIWRTDDAAGLRLPDSAAEIVLHTEALPPEIDFKVESADAAARDIEAAGGKVLVPPFDIPIGRCAVVADPWGNAFVILDASRGHYVTDDGGERNRSAEGTVGTYAIRPYRVDPGQLPQDGLDLGQHVALQLGLGIRLRHALEQVPVLDVLDHRAGSQHQHRA